MLSACLLAALIAAPLATVVLFVPLARPRLTTGRVAAAKRLTFALLATLVLAAAAGGCLAALGVTRRNGVVAIAALVAVSLVWLPATRRWNARGHLTWAMTFLLFVAYLVFMLDWTFASNLGAAGTAGGLLLWLLEAFAALLACAYLWELCDALGSEWWRRRIRDGASAPPGAALPFVSIQVPAHNEPPDMVIETLTSALALDYPNYEVLCLDDNTDDEDLWRPVEAWCAEHGVKFVHLADWPGYKSGALNYALAEMIDPRAELIGVVDSDYQLTANFLRRCAPLFADPAVGFIQAPQDYRDWQGAAFYRRLYYSYQYFFTVSQPSRNERNGAIFAGTMGLIRRRALEEVGGWDEWCITEDAELSLRLLRRGYNGLHVDASFGQGIMPLTFEALKGQRFRWCFGGIQILRRNWRCLLPGRREPDNQLGPGQRWAYLSGAVQWYGDLVGLVFFIFLLIGAGNIALHGGLLLRKLDGFLVATIPLLVLLGLVRAVALLRRGTGAGWRDALGAFLIWQSTSLVVAQASVQALYASKAEFLRTPKTMEEGNLWDAIKGNRGETLFGLLGVAGIAAALTNTSGYGGPLTAILLAWPTLAFLTAPINSLAAQRAALPPQLRERRRRELAGMVTPARATAAAGGVAVAVVAAVVVAALLAPGRAPVTPPGLVSPARGQAVGFHSARHATPSPSTSSSTTPSGSPSAAPSAVPTGSSATPSAGGSPPASSAPPSSAPASSPPASTPVPSASGSASPGSSSGASTAP